MTERKLTGRDACLPESRDSRIRRAQSLQNFIDIAAAAIQQGTIRRNQHVNRRIINAGPGADDGLMAAKRVPGKTQPGRGVEAGTQWRRLAVNIKAHTGVDREPLRHLPAILNVAAKIVSPAVPDGVIESSHYVDRQAEGERLGCAQVCALWACCRKTMAQIKRNQMSLHSGGRKRDKPEQPIFEIKFIVEP